MLLLRFLWHSSPLLVLCIIFFIVLSFYSFLYYDILIRIGLRLFWNFKIYRTLQNNTLLNNVSHLLSSHILKNLSFLISDK